MKAMHDATIAPSAKSRARRKDDKGPAGRPRPLGLPVISSAHRRNYEDHEALYFVRYRFRLVARHRRLRAATSSPPTPRAGRRRQAGACATISRASTNQGAAELAPAQPGTSSGALRELRARRGGGARAREEPRHPGRASSSRSRSTSSRRRSATAIGRALSHLRHARSVPAADQQLERRHQGQQRHDDLQLRPVAERAAVRRQLHGQLDQLARRHVEHVLDVQPELTRPTWSPPTRSRCCAASRSTTRASSC